MYKILALDIDGTLLNTKKEITPAVAAAVSRLQDAGIPVLIASGRPMQGIRHVADGLHMNERGGYILSFNGGRITEYKSGEVIYSKPVSQKYYKEVIEYADTLDASILTYDGDEIITEKPDNKYVDIESSVVRMPVRKVENLYETIVRDNVAVDKFLIVGEPEYMISQVEKMAEHFKGRLNVFQSEPFFIEVVPLGIDKASSLGVLLDRLGMTREELAACGDGKNDVTMIDYAGMGIAMENACDEVKAVADYITDSCDNDGVAKAIDKFFNI
jgi:hypothetical protein